MKTSVVIFLCIYGAVTANEDIHKRDKRQARWGSQRSSRLPTPTWAPTTVGTQANFGGQNWGNTAPTPAGFPSMFNDLSRSQNSLPAPPTSASPPSPPPGPKPPTKKRTSGFNRTSGHSNVSKSGGGPKKPRPGRGSPTAGRGPPTRPAPTPPVPTYPPTLPPRPIRRQKQRRNRPRSQSRSFAPKSNLKLASMIPPSFLQGLGRAMADKLRTMWLNPLYQQQAKAAGDNFVVNPNPVNIAYQACPPTIVSHRCVYNPCPRCRNHLIECWTNPCGGCTGEMYLRGSRIHDCETI
ncbi:SH3 domain-binding protein 1-like isoform X2 [Pecten maximus]|uniref:SH3 domain-binding protein 1-like isoform X2 n=1 Tax=Pecten maximus TaxID=6579 RepID=UPI0014582C31|nr:SH3 domain-binding protein 1-like isoform X2 [Pecten maximus]